MTRKLQINIPHEYRWKNSKQNLPIQIKLYIQRMLYLDQDTIKKMTSCRLGDNIYYKIADKGFVARLGFFKKPQKSIYNIFLMGRKFK